MSLLIIQKHKDVLHIVNSEKIDHVTVRKEEKRYFAEIYTEDSVFHAILKNVAQVEALITVLMISEPNSKTAYIIKDGKVELFKGVLEDFRKEEEEQFNLELYNGDDPW
ncbi:hypothetical protein E3E22_10490 [Thermococcus sp. MV5]|uniref:hypothetical protein n=1 Tax=Thermococcus sp. MV5 TaxID=1638272 RepID=UPI0014395CF5|nr:hypothetical protein [Thermococcus sp. MV5]NJE27028.1 hypothetical protein [Thermococcus sp. MV5]